MFVRDKEDTNDSYIEELIKNALEHGKLNLLGLLDSKKVIQSKKELSIIAEYNKEDIIENYMKISKDLLLTLYYLGILTKEDFIKLLEKILEFRDIDALTFLLSSSEVLKESMFYNKLIEFAFKRKDFLETVIGAFSLIGRLDLLPLSMLERLAITYPDILYKINYLQVEIRTLALAYTKHANEKTDEIYKYIINNPKAIKPYLGIIFERNQKDLERTLQIGGQLSIISVNFLKNKMEPDKLIKYLNARKRKLPFDVDAIKKIYKATKRITVALKIVGIKRIEEIKFINKILPISLSQGTIALLKINEYLSKNEFKIPIKIIVKIKDLIHQIYSETEKNNIISTLKNLLLTMPENLINFFAEVMRGFFRNSDKENKLLEIIQIVIDEGGPYVKARCAEIIGEIFKDTNSRSALEILKQLLMENEYIVEKAIKAIIKVFNYNNRRRLELLEIFKPLLKNSYWYTRRAAVLIIGELFRGTGSKEVLRILKPLIEDENELVARSVADAISIIFENVDPRRTLDALKPLLRSGFIAIAIGKIFRNASSEEALEILRSLLTDASAFIRITAAEALCKLLKDTNPKKLLEILKIPLIRDKKPRVRIRLIEIIRDIFESTSSKDVLEVLRIPLFRDEEYSVRLGAAEAIGRVFIDSCSEEALEILSISIKDTDELVRAAATLAIGRIYRRSGNKEALKIVKSLLGDKDWSVRCAVAEAIGDIYKGKKNLKALDILKPLLKEKNTSIRGEATIAIGKVFEGSGAEDILELLKKQLNERDMYLRKAAIRAIGKLFRGTGDKKILELLVPLINDEDLSIKEEAIRSIGEIYEGTASEAVLETLRRLLEHPSQYIVKATEEALFKIMKNSP